jgi:hypothetical protein
MHAYVTETPLRSASSWALTEDSMAESWVTTFRTLLTVRRHRPGKARNA